MMSARSGEKLIAEAATWKLVQFPTEGRRDRVELVVTVYPAGLDAGPAADLGAALIAWSAEQRQASAPPPWIRVRCADKGLRPCENSADCKRDTQSADLCGECAGVWWQDIGEDLGKGTPPWPEEGQP